MTAEDEKRERKRLALEAERLIKDETLLKVLADIRQEAVDLLLSADAANTAAIIRCQAQAIVCDEFMAKLKSMIDLQKASESGSQVFG